MLLHLGDWNKWDYEINWEGEYFRTTDLNATDLRSKITLMGVKGNHEGAKGITYRKYFPFPYKSDIVTGNKWSYSYDYGPVHFTVMYVNNNNYDLSQLEKDWLDWDLASTSKQWKVIMFHAPVNTLRAGLSSAGTISAIKQKAKQYGVQLVLMGHEHYFSHWIEDGTHYLTLGGGGAYVEGVIKSIVQSSDEIYAATVPHFAKFDIQGDFMKVDIIQGKAENNYPSGRRIEKFSIPISTEITSNYNFNNPSDHPILTDNITIKQGGTLTVNSTINIAKEGKVIIEKGGKLIIDGGNAEISNTDRAVEYLNFHNDTDGDYTENDNMWEGIVVQGNYGSKQIPETNQGVLIMKNGAAIKNAMVGITVGQQEGASKRGGGIIKINNSKFSNNHRDIVMYPYSLLNEATFKPFSQRSNIQMSLFETNQDIILDEHGYGKECAISLREIKGLNIQGNTFINNDNSIELWDRGSAIYAVNSTLNITSYCNPQITPCTNIPNTITNYTYGVNVVNGINSEDLVKINKNKFIDTYRAIFLSGTYSAEVLLNDIKLEDDLSSYGIYLNGGKGFKVEENTIYRPSSNGAAELNGARGIIVHNTGGVENEIYNNNLTNLYISNQAQMYNSGSGVNASLGLKYLCNNSQTSDNSYDFQTFGNWYRINDRPFLWSLHQSGIAEFQQHKAFDSNLGYDVPAPAGNQFSSNHLTNETTVFDFDNGDAAKVRYGWGDLTTTGEKWKPTEIDNLENRYIPISSEVDVCPSKIITENNPTDFYAKLSTAQIAFNSSNILLNIWRDGGNANLKNEVKTTQPWDVYVEFNSLLAESPYLSEVVILEVINNPAFTSLMIKLLMIANPHARESYELMEALEKRNPAMPQSYIVEIKNQPETSSQLKLLEANVAADYHLVSNIGEDIKRMYRGDNINVWAKDSLIAFTSRQPDVYDKFELATIYLSYKQYEDMQGVLDEIINDYELKGEQQDELVFFGTICEIASQIQQENLYEDGLSENNRIDLQTIFNANKPLTSTLALALLKRDNPDYVYNELVFDMKRNSSRMANPKPLFENPKQNSGFKLYPNPTKDYTTLSYNCKYHNLTYTIIDNSSKTLFSGKLISIEHLDTNEVLIDLSQLSGGNYQIIIKTYNTVLWSEKLIIAK